MHPNDCPVCHAPGGFHDEGPHSAAREAIPAELRRPSNSALRRERRASAVDEERAAFDREQERRFADGADGRRLLADMAAALLTPDAPHLDR